MCIRDRVILRGLGSHLAHGKPLSLRDQARIDAVHGLVETILEESREHVGGHRSQVELARATGELDTKLLDGPGRHLPEQAPEAATEGGPRGETARVLGAPEPPSSRR